MAKIKITGINDFVEVSNEQAKSIKQLVCNEKVSRDSMIDVGNEAYKKSAIIAVKLDNEISASSGRLCERLDDDIVRETVKAFERELENYTPATLPAEAYGKPVTIKKFISDEQWAINPLLGGWPLNIIQYAIDNHYIRNNGREWVVLEEGGNLIRYNEFYEKLMAIRELRRRREYVQKQEGQNTYQDMKENLKEKVAVEEALPF